MMTDLSHQKELVRSVERRRAGWLAGALLCLLLAYPLGFGPACTLIAWQVERDMTSGRGAHSSVVASSLHTFYQPLARGMVFGPRPVKLAMLWWVGLWLPGPMRTFEWPEGFGWTAVHYSYTFVSY